MTETTPMIDGSTPGLLDARLQQLADRFAEIGQTKISDLPIYNSELEVEAIGFVPHGEGWLGVLTTPWFMNLIILPESRQDYDPMALGRRVDKDIPSGTWPFSQAGDELIGGFFSKPLHSPMDNFQNQDMARATAEAAIEAALKAPEPDAEPDVEPGPAHDAVPACEEKVNQGRRTLFQGPFGKTSA